MSSPVRRRRLLVWGASAAVLAAAGGTAAALVTSGGPGRVRVTIRPPASTSTVPPTSEPAPTTTAAAGPTASCGPLEQSGSSSSATASLGTVTARLAGRTASAFGEQSLDGATLTVTDGGSTVLSVPVAPPKDMTYPPHPAVIPWSLAPIAVGTGPATAQPAPSQPLCLARFAGSTTPAVVLGLNLGGAHCCTVVRTYRLPDGATVEVDQRNTSATVESRPQGAIVVTGDDAFNYRFASYGSSGVPIKILELRGGALVDTTRSYPDLIAEDSARWKQAAFSATTADRLGVLAAWAADQCLVGRSASAMQTIDLLNQQGSLTGPAGWPTGPAYVNALRSFLTAQGYL